jgi:hypothetical protein
MIVRMMIDLIRSIVNVVLTAGSDILEMNKSICIQTLLYYIKTIYLCKEDTNFCVFLLYSDISILLFFFSSLYMHVTA